MTVDLFAWNYGLIVILNLTLLYFFKEKRHDYTVYSVLATSGFTMGLQSFIPNKKGKKNPSQTSQLFFFFT